MLIKPDYKQEKQKRAGIPDTKKLERTGKDTFVVKADGGQFFEGKITDPNVKFYNTGGVTIKGFCVRKCLNRNTKCLNCYRFSNYADACN